MYHQVPYTQHAHLLIPTRTIGAATSVLLLLAWALCAGPTTAISIDNDIIGEPDIECLDQEIRVWVKTRKFFAGRIYAKGKSEDPECSKSNFVKERSQKPHFDLPLGMCGMKSLRSFDPRGMYYGVTLVISFHPLFITKVDQAFHVKCFFEEASRGLTAELGVRINVIDMIKNCQFTIDPSSIVSHFSMIPTTEVNARHNIMGCSYSIHRSSIVDLDAGRPAGTAIQFAKVGDKVLHQWHCEDPMYGVLINNCYVTDGVNKKAQVIDAHGCPIDPILITGIRYSADLQRAYAESQVFKFADRPGVWFFCQIQMCMKKDGMCDGITPPACATTSKSVAPEERAGAGRRDDNDGEENAVSGGSVTEVIPAGVESEAGEPPPLHPTRISTDKIPNDYEAYTESTAAAIPRGGRKNNARNNGRGGRPQSGGGAPDGYGPVENPSFDDYNSDNNDDDSSGTPSIFGPGLSPGQDVYASQDSAPKTLFDENRNKTSGANVAPPLSIRESATLKLRPPPPNKSTPASFGRDGNQEASLSFETNDDLRTSHRGPPGSRHTAVSTTPNTRTTLGEKPRTLATSAVPSAIKKDYTDYDDKENAADDVELPNNLASILAKLPADEINAANLQRMFRDSVSDRRALLNGFEALTQKILNKKENSEETPFSTTSPFVIGANSRRTNFSGAERRSPGTKIHTLNVDWNSPARDSPLPSSSEVQFIQSKRNLRGKADERRMPTNLEDEAHSQHKVNLRGLTGPSAGVAPQMIAGQLLIYDLDETPPDDAHLSGGQHSDSLETDCALSRVGATVLASTLSAVIALLTIVIVALLLKIQRRKSSRDGYHRR